MGDAFRSPPPAATLAGKKTSKVLPQPGLAADFNPAMMLFDDAVGRGQAQAGAFADILGGEERLENAFERALVHAHAGVGHRER